MKLPLESKLALVTGASRGIGAAIAIRLAQEGASVIVHYSASKARAEGVLDQIRKAGGQAEAVGADLYKKDAVKTLVASIDKAFGGKFGGRLDILVNNAGTVDFGPFLETSEETYDRMFDLNVRALMNVTRELGKRMVKSGWGRIINIGAGLGESAPLPGVTLYCVTKFAVQGFTRALSRELGSTGVTVNNVQPGPVDTELNPADGPYAEAMKKITSVGHFGKPDDVAYAVAFLASPESSFINGISLSVDGGWRA
jgi:3-oxoacyl-[acyl-carrier protein] reductase